MRERQTLRRKHLEAKRIILSLSSSDKLLAIRSNSSIPPPLIVIPAVNKAVYANLCTLIITTASIIR